MVAQEREVPLSVEEMETIHFLVERLMTETDQDRFRAIVEQLQRMVERDPPRRRSN